MKIKNIVLMLVMISALTLTTVNRDLAFSQGTVVPSPSGPFEKFGPRVDRLVFSVAGGVIKEADDFEAGFLDLMDWSAPAERWSTWLEDPEITMGEMGEFAAIYLALNTMRWPLGHGDQLPEGWTSFPAGYISNHDLNLWSKDPSSDLPIGTADKVYIDYNCQRDLDARWFRRGLAHMADRAAQVAYMLGAGVALDPTLLYTGLEGWRHPNVTETYDRVGYVTKYAYDLVKARAAFERGGFKDWDGDGIMEYSPTHDGTVIEELPTIHFYTRVDDDHRIYMGRLVSEGMKLLGIPHFLDIATYGTVATEVWAKYDYDIYIEYWDWGRMPDLYSEWFMSKMDIYPEPWGNNEHRYHSKELDYWADLFTTASSPEEAKPYHYKMQEIIHRDVPAIPLYMYVGFNAHKTKYGTWTGEEKYAGRLWEGMNNFPGGGFYSNIPPWTMLNAHPQGFEKGGVLRHGLNVDAAMLDIVDTWYSYDWYVMYNIYEYLVVGNPWDLSKYEPWLAEGYAVGNWTKPDGSIASAVNFTLIPSILWQDGVSMTASDVAYTFQFTRDVKGVTYTFAKDFQEAKIYPNTPPGKETIEIRFKVKSWMALYWTSNVPIIPEHIWSDKYQRYCPIHQVYEWGPGVAGSPTYIPEDHAAVIGTGPFRFFKDGVVGKVNRVLGEYLYLKSNPLYFRKYIWPDVTDKTHTPGALDKWVDLDDFMEVAKPGNIFTRENPDGTWPSPPGVWGEYCDVNKDGKIGVGDLMEIAVNFAEPWPPAYYLW